ncbi:metallophosphoesterase [Streptomyces sp. NBC_01166]|uniref:metallophosphoesterase n=1 Tax=Streptomyces sp. NBC_01166 TaxID=2903755 RepID=UPI00386D4DBF|nr:metallophosphoesterase [Streptomyces sp. NBC_01166]
MLAPLVNLLIVVASALIHRWLWVRLVRDTTRPGGTARRVGTVAIVVSAALAAAPRILVPALGPDTGRPLAWTGYVWLGVLLYLMLALLMMEIPRAVVGIRARARGRIGPAPAVAEPARVPVASVPRGAEKEALAGAGRAPAGAGGAPETGSTGPARPDRRLFLSRAGALTAGAVAATTTGFGMRTALGDPVVKRVPIRIAGLARPLSGLRIAVVSDLHLGPLLGRSHTERIVRMINGLEADVVTVVGDLADGKPSELAPAARPLRHLESTHGAFFVTGNHEYMFDGAEAWVEELHDLGVTTLLNERREIRHHGAVLDLAGVEDLSAAEHGSGPDYARALGGRDTSRPVVLMAHQPVMIEEAARHGVDLQLSGHTHGGQMFPLTELTKLANPVVSGLGKVDDTQLYVTNGAGFFGPPVRVGAEPEITVIELRA